MLSRRDSTVRMKSEGYTDDGAPCGHVPGILRACGQIYTEVILLYYATTQFDAQLNGIETRKLRTLERSKAVAVRQMTVRLCSSIPRHGCVHDMLKKMVVDRLCFFGFQAVAMVVEIEVWTKEDDGVKLWPRAVEE